MPKYNNAFTIAFQIPNCDTEDGRELTDLDFAIALNRRIADCLEHGQLAEAVGLAYDSFEEDEHEQAAG